MDNRTTYKETPTGRKQKVEKKTQNTGTHE